MEMFTVTSGICATCGTEVLRDEETMAEVHRNPTYDRCGVEGELRPLVEWAYPATRPRALRVVR